MDSVNQLKTDDVVLQVQGLASGYPPLRVLSEIDLVVCKGEAVVLLGANGAGKTTLLRSIMSLLPLMAGQVLLNGVDTSNARPDQKVRLGMAFMSETAIFADLTIDENLRMGGYMLPSSKVRPRKEELYQAFPDLAQRKRSLGGSLSGGQRKMLGFAKALMQEPALLLLDEPSSGLSPKYVTGMIDVLKSFHEQGLALLIAEQNVAFLDVAERGYVLDGGCIVDSGAVAALRDNNVVRRAYFGTD